METGEKKKRRVSNIIMVLLIVVIAGCGIMAVGSVQGWFSGEGDSQIVSEEIKGVANIERSGVGYSLKEKVPLEEGDLIETKSGAVAELAVAGDNKVVLNENTELKITACREDNIKLEVVSGEIFADMPDVPKTFDVTFGGNTAHVTGTVFSVSAQQGSSSLDVLEGTVEVDAEDGSQQTVKAGQRLSVAMGGGDQLTVEVGELKVEALNDFLIEQAQGCSSADDLCFKQSALAKVLEERQAEKQEAEKAQKSGDAIAASESGSSGSSGNGSSSSSSSSSSGSNPSCTITIRCDTILNNMSGLTAGKSQYVPSNGVILAASKVEFVKGETVFDVLKRACNYTGIQLEYSYTPMYGSYYIEGINHLYEFDCGEQSGWMYKVNGWFPNYGCSSYTLKNGDNIVWCYTCKGLGADVGGSVY
ncbi:MAG: DUF4430 domain-containing protein [Bacillota bacterium]|nr:DUF4430 domain-containing protein [Bacillota bacterium]